VPRSSLLAQKPLRAPRKAVGGRRDWRLAQLDRRDSRRQGLRVGQAKRFGCAIERVVRHHDHRTPPGLIGAGSRNEIRTIYVAPVHRPLLGCFVQCSTPAASRAGSRSCAEPAIVRMRRIRLSEFPSFCLCVGDHRSCPLTGAEGEWRRRSRTQNGETNPFVRLIFADSVIKDRMPVGTGLRAIGVPAAGCAPSDVLSKGRPAQG
jgi:hypothetical protein